MQNARFFSYYKAQRIVPDEEWDGFVESLRSHLPVTFRVAGNALRSEIGRLTVSPRKYAMDLSLELSSPAHLACLDSESMVSDIIHHNGGLVATMVESWNTDNTLEGFVKQSLFFEGTVG
jgi:hypothetical protein